MAEPIPEDEYEIVMRFAKRSIDRLESLPPGWVADLLQLLAEAEAERDALRTALEAAEARAVPEGPGDLAVKLSRVMHEYSLTEAEEGAVERATDILLQLDLDLRDAARLVPLSPTDTPEEA